MSGIRAVAPAKVNLGLRVAALRGDGYHQIDTLFAALDLHDDLHLRIEPMAGTTPEVAGTIRTDDPFVAAALPPMDATNLAVRAARAWLEASGARLDVRIELVKRIPVAAGLGGGSSDAGAVLRALEGAPHPDAAERVDGAALAKRLGSDVPFFRSGLAAARGRGRGERLAERPLAPPRPLVLANPGVPVPVARAYEALGGYGPPIDWEALTRAWRDGATPPLRNDLQHGVFRIEPEVRAAWSALAEAGGRRSTLSGSGGTSFALADDAAHAARIADQLRTARPDWWVRTATAPVAPPAPERASSTAGA